MLTLFRKMAASTALGMAVVSPTPVFADHWHGHFGFYFGVPLYAPYYSQSYYPPYPAPYYYGYPSAPYGPPAPPIYVEPGPAQSAPQPPQTAYWYYCPDSNAYYPYVASCPSPWQPVPTQPPAQAR